MSVQESPQPLSSLGSFKVQYYDPIVQRLECPVVSRKIAGSNPVRVALDSYSNILLAYMEPEVLV